MQFQIHMYEKIITVLSEYSNFFLVLITLVVLIILIIPSRERELTSHQTARMLYVCLEKTYNSQDTEKDIIIGILRDLEELPGLNTGKNGRILIEELEKISELEAETGRNTDIPASLRVHLHRIIDAYYNIETERSEVFHTLFYFLLLGIVIQSVFLLVSVSSTNRTLQKKRKSDLALLGISKTLERERFNIASFLHDSVLQDLASILLDRSVSHSEHMRKKLEHIIVQTRNLTYNTAPLKLEEYGLIPNLEDLINDYQDQKSIKIEFQTYGVNEELLDRETRLVLYRICQEGLNNITKHSKADTASIKLTYSQPYLYLIIKDNGIGIPKVIKSGKKVSEGMGLLLMEQKAVSINGNFAIDSDSRNGTTIKMSFKLRNIHEKEQE